MTFTYPFLAPVTRRPILIEQQRSLSFQLSTNLLCVSESEHLVSILQLIPGTPAGCALGSGTHCCSGHLIPVHWRYNFISDGEKARRVSSSASGISPFSLAAAGVKDLAVVKLEGSGRLSMRTDSDWYSSSACRTYMLYEIYIQVYVRYIYGIYWCMMKVDGGCRPTLGVCPYTYYIYVILIWYT